VIARPNKSQQDRRNDGHGQALPGPVLALASVLNKPKEIPQRQTHAIRKPPLSTPSCAAFPHSFMLPLRAALANPTKDAMRRTKAALAFLCSPSSLRDVRETCKWIMQLLVRQPRLSSTVHWS
jgi:hypothetical protein